MRDYFGIPLASRHEYWRRGAVWGALYEEGLIAFVIVWPLKREPVLSLYCSGVCPEWRGAGLLSRIMKVAVRHYPEHPLVRVVSNEHDREAFALYSHWGLVHQGRKETRKNGCVDVWEGRPSWS